MASFRRKAYLVPCIVSAGAAAGKGQSPDAAPEVHRLWQKLPVFPLHSGSLLPLQHVPEGPQDLMLMEQGVDTG